MQKAVYLLSTFVLVFLCTGVSSSGQENAVQGKRLARLQDVRRDGYYTLLVYPPDSSVAVGVFDRSDS